MTQHWHWERKWTRDIRDPQYDGNVGCLEPGVLWYGVDGAEGIYCPNEEHARLIVAAPMLLNASQAALQSLRTLSEDHYKCGSTLDDMLVEAIVAAAGKEGIPRAGTNRSWTTQAIIHHDRLVEACKQSLEVLESLRRRGLESMGVYRECLPVREMLEAALAAAKGQ